MNVDNFLEKFLPTANKELITLYNGEVRLWFEREEHKYWLELENGELQLVEGVSTVSHIIDKSPVLLPWACLKMAEKLLVSLEPYRNTAYYNVNAAKLESLVNAAKSAHKEELDKAGKVGTIAHDWVEQYIKIVLSGDQLCAPEFPKNESAKNCCLAALGWMGDHKVRWIATEKVVYSRIHGYAGTLDGLAYVSSCDDPTCCQEQFTDKICVVDWKSSNHLYSEFRYQTAGYLVAFTEEFPEYRYKLHCRWIVRLGKIDGEFDPWYLNEVDLLLDFKTFLDALSLTRNNKAVEDRVQELKNLKKAAVKQVKAEIKESERVLKASNKLKAKAEKEEMLKVKCKGADKYKGTRYPTCNGGNPCESCLTKYKERHGEDSL